MCGITAMRDMNWQRWKYVVPSAVAAALIIMGFVLVIYGYVHAHEYFVQHDGGSDTYPYSSLWVMLLCLIPLGPLLAAITEAQARCYSSAAVLTLASVVVTVGPVIALEYASFLQWCLAFTPAQEASCVIDHAARRDWHIAFRLFLGSGALSLLWAGFLGWRSLSSRKATVSP